MSAAIRFAKLGNNDTCHSHTTVSMRKIDKLKDKQHDLKHQIRDLTEEHMRLVLLLQEHHIQYERVQ